MNPTVYLGFEDDLILKQHELNLDYTINKVGGKPNWVEGKKGAEPKCQLCKLPLPMVLQIYAPLEKSQYHRTLYLFGCINPNCWDKKESWVCLRSQVLDCTEPQQSEKKVNNIDWCEGANSWGDEDVMEETSINVHELDVTNANLCYSKESNTEVKHEIQSTVASADIESDDDNINVIIDKPVGAQSDLVKLMNQVKSVPQLWSLDTMDLEIKEDNICHSAHEWDYLDILNDVPQGALEFKSFYISVLVEDQSKEVTECLPQQIATLCLNKDPLGPMDTSSKDPLGPMDTSGIESNGEEYEKGIPCHGDTFFHRFISTIKKNPNQILRYIRDGGVPLYLYPAEDLPLCCQHCKGDLIMELQLLPTIVSSLQLVGSGTGHIEFGTVFILACKNSCWQLNDITRTEYVYVQREK